MVLCLVVYLEMYLHLSSANRLHTNTEIAECVKFVQSKITELGLQIAKAKLFFLYTSM